MPDIASDKEYWYLRNNLDGGSVPEQAKRTVTSALMRYESINPQLKAQGDAMRAESSGIEANRSRVQAIDEETSPAAMVGPGEFAGNKAPTGEGKPVRPAPPTRGDFGSGMTEQFVEPSFQEFLRQKSPELQSSMDVATFNKMKEFGPKSAEFQEWANDIWQAELDKAKAEGRNVSRVSPELFSGPPGRSFGQKAADFAGQALDTSVAAATGAGDALLFPGFLTGAAETVGNVADLVGVPGAEGAGKKAANYLRQATERHPNAAMLGAARGSLAPTSVESMAARGVYGGLSPLANRVSSPIARGAGRTAAAGIAGGTAAALGGAIGDKTYGAVFGEPEPEAEAAMIRRFVTGAAPGAGLHLLGEGARFAANSIEQAHPEIAGARKAGVRPALTGAVAGKGSPVHEMEARRQAEQMDSLEHSAAAGTGPRLVDAAADANARSSAAAKAETAAMYDSLDAAGTKASTAPVVDRLKRMVDQEHINPETGRQVPFTPSDRKLREELKGAMVVETRDTRPRPEATRGRDTAPPGPLDKKAKLFEQEMATEGEWRARLNNLQREVNSLKVVEPPATGKITLGPGEHQIPTNDAIELGLVPPGTTGAVIVRPTRLSARQFDLMVKGLQDEASFNDARKTGDTRYRALEGAAMEAREGFGPEFTGMKARQERGLREERQRVEGASIRMGKDNKVRSWDETEANDRKAVLEAVANYKKAGRGAGSTVTDKSLREIAEAGGLRDELELIPSARSVDELLESVSGAGGLHGVVGEGGARAYGGGKMIGAAAIRLQPTLKAIGSSPKPEKELQAMAQAISPKLRKVLVSMRKDVKGDLGVSALAQRVGLRGGIAGQRAATVVEEGERTGAFSTEDLENLLKLKRAVSAATPAVPNQ